MIRPIATIAALLVSPPLVASAQTNSHACQHRMIVESLDFQAIGGDQNEYDLRMRNLTSTPITADVIFSGSPNTVTLFSPTLAGVPIPAYGATEALGFGWGTSNPMGPANVARVHDAFAGGGPTMRVRNCRAG